MCPVHRAHGSSALADILSGTFTPAWLSGYKPDVLVRLSLNVRLGVQGFEFHSGVGGGESPVGPTATDVPVRLLGRDGGIEFFSRGESPITEALA